MNELDDVPEHLREFMVTREMLNEMTEKAMGIAIISANGNDTMPPALHVHYRERTPEGGVSPLCMALCVIMDPCETAAEKHAVLAGLGRKFMADGKLVMAIVLASEAWISKQRVGAPHIEPAKDPQRQEIILVMGATCARATRGGKIAITRNADNRIAIKGSVADADWTTEGEWPLLNHFWMGYISDPGGLAGG